MSNRLTCCGTYDIIFGGILLYSSEKVHVDKPSVIERFPAEGEIIPSSILIKVLFPAPLDLVEY